jgi:hypothetical protein
VPDFKSHRLKFTAQLVIPEAEHLDSLAGEELISFFVSGPLVGKTVSTAIKLNGEFCHRAVKIEEVYVAGILTPEFEFSEAAVTQQTPQAFFSIRGFFPQVAREAAGCCGAGAVFAVARLPPHPSFGRLLPQWGRGRRQRRAAIFCGLQMRPAFLGLVEDQRGWIGIGLAHSLADTLWKIDLYLVSMKLNSRK